MSTEENALSYPIECDEQQRLEMEAYAFRKLVKHLQNRTDVQNIDLMNLSGFCRNCLSKWYVSAAEKKDISISYDEAREMIYGMPYSEWKTKFQTEITSEQKEKFDKRES